MAPKNKLAAAAGPEFHARRASTRRRLCSGAPRRPGRRGSRCCAPPPPAAALFPVAPSPCIRLRQSPPRLTSLMPATVTSHAAGHVRRTRSQFLVPDVGSPKAITKRRQYLAQPCTCRTFRRVSLVPLAGPEQGPGVSANAVL